MHSMVISYCLELMKTHKDISLSVTYNGLVLLCVLMPL